jgi:AcrR family transcriptional regulator
MARKADVSDRILSAALELAAAGGWRSLSLAEIAGEAGVSLAEAYAAYPTKASILAGFIARTDRQVLAGGATGKEDSVRDRLFEVLMRRFDALTPHKDAVAGILRDLPSDPASILATAPQLANGMAWMVETAGLSSSGLKGAIRVNGLTLIYLNTLRVWLRDDSADMARTMASLDQGLRRAESLIRCCRSRSRGLPRGSDGDQGVPKPEAPAEG